MATMDSDSHSTCSSLPSAAVNQPRKQSVSIRRFSIRRFIYSSPLGRLREGRRRWLAGSDPEEGVGSSHQNRSKNASKYEHTQGASTSTSLTAVIINHGTQTTPCDSQSAPLAAATSTWGAGDQSLDILECPLCLTELHVDLFPQLITCTHRSCRDCMRQYLRIEISESRVNICCPECSEALHPSDIQSILQDDVIMAKWEEFMLRRLLVAEPDVRWCPAPDCGFAVIASGCASCPRLRCERPGCHTYFCYHCKQEWHPNLTCDAARAQRSPYIRNASVSYGQDSSLPRDDIKPCPRCQVLVVKMDDGSCNHMTCAFCGAEFCWLCMKEISDLHYLSPSGCTFWGKKPWSRKKKILWQLGTLVGAPVGIGLVAGIAVPTIIIGIPVWVARKLHARYEHASRRKRNLVITGSVLASVLVSPILAGLAVGIGVPILLAYVYCVVPISLCRSGGCGVTTSASGVRFDFDEDETVSGGNTGHTTDGQSVDTSRDRVANPSIGDVSLSLGPCSVSLGSGSALGMKEMDRESNTGLAGSITGHRLEVHADVSSGKRFSLTSETASATVSLSEKSDDASTRALAGSLLGYRSREPVTCYTPAEVHIDSVSQCSVTTGDDVRSDDVTLRSSARLQRLRLRPSVEKQLNTPGEAETDSVASGDDVISERVTSSRDDVTSERVRFDDHVSFIDEEWPTTSGGTPTMSRKEGYDWPRDSAISRQDVSPSSPDSWKSADSNPELEAASVQIYVESSVSRSPTEV